LGFFLLVPPFAGVVVPGLAGLTLSDGRGQQRNSMAYKISDHNPISTSNIKTEASMIQNDDEKVVFTNMKKQLTNLRLFASTQM
jgi:hypothetical protein